MKQKTIFIMVLLVFYMTLTLAIFGVTQDEDDRGKLVCQILDAETGGPVDEIFSTLICKPLSKTSTLETPVKKITPYTFLPFSIRSDKDGKFECKLRSGTYILTFYPLSPTSKYSDDLSPYDLYITPNQTINIKKGQILKFVKKASYGGRLLIRCVDSHDNEVNFRNKSLFHKDAEVSVCFYLDKPFLLCNKTGLSKSEFPNLKDNELMFFGLKPDNINIAIMANDMGYGKVDKKNIEIKSKALLEIKYIIDFDDSTGIEGVVIDNAGVPIPAATVTIRYKNKVGRDVYFSRTSAVTDSKGYYKIVGLEEGIAGLRVWFYRNSKEIEHSVPDEIKIINHIVSKKNIQIDN
jgi:hypothetical protein